MFSVPSVCSVVYIPVADGMMEYREGQLAPRRLDAIAFANSRLFAPAAKAALNIRSSETPASPASIFATRD